MILREHLPGSIATYRKVTALSGHRIDSITTNITHSRVRNTQKPNDIVPAWRDAAYSANIDICLDLPRIFNVIREQLAHMNRNQNLLNSITSNRGTHIKTTYIPKEFSNHSITATL